MPMPRYDQSEEATMPEGAAAPDAAEAPAEQPQEQMGKNEHTMFISPEHLGGLDPNSINPGDILEFKVVGRDKDGDIEVEYNTGDGGDSGSGMDKMKNDLADHMAGAGTDRGASQGGEY